MLSRSQDPSLDMDERLRILYPMVNEAETPLPRDAFTGILYITYKLQFVRVTFGRLIDFLEKVTTV